MAWIETRPKEPVSAEQRKRLRDLRTSFPPEYEVPAPKASPTEESIVASHGLIPDAQFHAFATMGVLMSDDLPLSRAQHEMIATIVSETNDCFY